MQHALTKKDMKPSFTPCARSNSSLYRARRSVIFCMFTSLNVVRDAVACCASTSRAAMRLRSVVMCTRRLAVGQRDVRRRIRRPRRRRGLRHGGPRRRIHGVPWRGGRPLNAGRGRCGRGRRGRGSRVLRRALRGRALCSRAGRRGCGGLLHVHCPDDLSDRHLRACRDGNRKRAGGGSGHGHGRLVGFQLEKVAPFLHMIPFGLQPGGEDPLRD